jgi:transketolase
MGIAEHNMVSVAAGLAATGFVPYVATFASFLALLCCEQIRTDLAYTNLPVRLLGHHAGISLGYYGTSHHATEDIAIMNSMANMKIVCPADAYSLRQALLQTVNVEGPIYFRLGRGRDPDVYQESNEWNFGRISVLRDGHDALIISNGLMVSTALQAASILKDEGINLTVADLHTVRPLDKKGLLSLLGRSSMIFVAEEHSTMGGVASAVADTIVESNIQNTHLYRLGLPPDEYAIVGPPFYLYKHYKLDADSLAERIRITLQRER